MPGLIAEEGGGILGAVTWSHTRDEFEVVTLDAFDENRGVGTVLLGAAVSRARQKGAKRAWLVTSNDNTHAIRFYQRRGWSMAAFHREAIVRARKIKPDIPERGNDDIPIRDEIEFELLLE